MSIQFSPKYDDIKNEISILEELSKNFEIHQQKISLILNNVKLNENLYDSNIKLSKSSSMRSKKSPNYYSKLSMSNPKNNKYGCFGFPEDLTEVTITDVITEPSDSCQSIANINNKNLIFYPMDINLNMDYQNMPNNFILLAPDNTYKNAIKYNQHINEKCLHQDNHNANFIKDQKYKIHFPLLQIDRNGNYPKKLTNIKMYEEFPRQIFDKFLLNDVDNINKIDFLISPEDIICNNIKKESRTSSLKINKSIEEKRNNKIEFIRDNLLHVNAEKSFDDLSINSSRSEKNIEPLSNLYEKKIISFEEKVFDDKTMDISTNSDVVFHHGYMITPDGITNKKNSRGKEKVKNTKENLNIKDEENMNGQIRQTELLIKKDEIDITKIGPIIKTNGEEILPQKNSLQINLQGIPILPPDILGNINLDDGIQKSRKFLGIKSIDENGWSDIKDINMNDSFCKTESKKKLNLVIKSSDNKTKMDNLNVDQFTVNIFDPKDYHAKVKRDLNNSFKKMDSKINEMEKFSSAMEMEFANSNIILLDNCESDIINNVKSEFNKKSLEKALVLVPNDEEIDSDKTIFSESSIFSGNSVIQNLSDDSISKNYIPKIDLNISDNDISSYHIINSKAVTMKHLTHSPIKKRENKFRNELEKSNYFRRKTQAELIAKQMLNQLGLPPNSSADISVKVSEGPSVNAMMLAEMKRNRHCNPARTMEPGKQNSQIYKPIKHKAYLEKVRLQRPEITRRKNSKEPITYNQSLLSLQPQRKNQNNIYNEKLIIRNTPRTSARSLMSHDAETNSIFSDWTIPDDINRMLYSDSKNIGMDDLSQVYSIQSNSFLDWDQISEMIKSPTLNK